jgi:hypothetical protein
MPKQCIGEGSLPEDLWSVIFMGCLAEVAQSVERGPEKAGVGGSIPSLGISYLLTMLQLASTWTKFLTA